MNVHNKLFVGQPYHPKVLLNRQDAVGRHKGTIFDSGCNLSGVRKVHLLYSMEGAGNGNSDEGRLQRLYFTFDNDDNDDSKCMTPSYDHEDVTYLDYFKTFALRRNESVVQIEVWMDGRSFCITGIRFYLNTGAFSELYGTIDEDSEPPVFFGGGHPDSRLVGVYGYYEFEDINAIGFSFATVVDDNNRVAFPLALTPPQQQQQQQRVLSPSAVVEAAASTTALGLSAAEWDNLLSRVTDPGDQSHLKKKRRVA